MHAEQTTAGAGEMPNSAEGSALEGIPNLTLAAIDSDGERHHELQHLPTATLDDQEREQQIARLYQELLATTDPKERRQIMTAMAMLVEGRSPEQVQRMERDRGLR